ncbi:hypothetical protein PR202_ga31630 [Eleusine coracana subsp. coracana]|uniref:Uncharacterized protein n=1 Tax=Eleusine coracana subsp. coracana TaxID=191504 RepID=A0AAV5DS14_ELECO|nr:hypothetical protein PR202_ga31630 [Eleusine coracana subsp. coracana]
METLQCNELFAGLLLLLVTILLLKQLLPASKASSTKRRTTSLPRPRGLPVIGNLHQLGASPHNSLAALSARLGAPLMLLRLGSVPALVVSTADALRAAFQPNDRAMSGRPVQYAATRITYGMRDIVFSHPDGAFWRAARRASLSELLGAPRVRGFRGVREGEAAALVNAVAELSGKKGAPVNLSEKVMATSNKIVRRVAFGDDDEGDYTIDAGAVLEETQYLLGAFFVADYVPWLGWLDALRGLRRRLEKNFRELDAFYERVIDDHIKKKRGEDSKEQDLVDVLLRLHGDPAHGDTFGNRSHLKGILTDMLVPPRPPRDHRAVLRAWLRNPGQDAGTRERQGHRPGPRSLGGRSASRWRGGCGAAEWIDERVEVTEVPLQPPPQATERVEPPQPRHVIRHEEGAQKPLRLLQHGPVARGHEPIAQVHGRSGSSLVDATSAATSSSLTPRNPHTRGAPRSSDGQARRARTRRVAGRRCSIFHSCRLVRICE